MLEFRKNDICLIFVTMIIAAVFIFSKKITNTNGVVKVYVDNSLYGQYSLTEDRIISIEYNGKVINELTVSNESVFMNYATCPDHYCVKQQRISTDGESICCLPNKVIVTIESVGGSEYDAITQ